MNGTTPSSIKLLKNGQLSFRLPTDLREMIIQSIRYRIEYSTVDLFLQYLLEEAITALRRDGKIRMRKSEFFAVFHPEQMRYFESSTMILIRSHLGNLPAPSMLPDIE